MTRLLVIVGGVGAGKTTLARELIKLSPHAAPVESETTRPKRKSDVDGEYKYLSEAQFERSVEKNRYLWHVTHAGVRYGTSAKAVEYALKKPGHIGIMIVVPQVLDRLDKFVADYKQVAHDSHAHWMLFRIKPPPPEELCRRLIARGDSADDIHRRLKAEEWWNYLAMLQTYDGQYIDNSGPLEVAVAQLAPLLDLRKVR